MAATCSGTYKTRRDGGVEYAYEASWTQSRGAIVWNCTVTRGGEVAGAPGGSVTMLPPYEPEPTVRILVERAIEDRAGVR
jgi:hypothetical protein